jgi:RNA polymerase sigma-70 factor, ECF subfamily
MRLNAGDYASPATDFGRLMMLYQRGDRTAVTVLVKSLSPQLYRFFASQLGSRTDAEDMLQDAWLRIHRVRHTYRLGEPLLPWVYAIARRVRVDHYRKRQRIASRETPADMLPELRVPEKEPNRLLSFEELVASLPESQCEVLVMLKVNDLSIEEVARAMSSTVGAVKQKAHRAYEHLRKLLEQAPRAEADRLLPANAEPSCTTLH